MIIKVTIGEQSKDVEVPDEVLTDGKSFFNKMDADMDCGWQMGADYVESPDRKQRCQIAADKVLDAIGTHNNAATDAGIHTRSHARRFRDRNRYGW